MVLIPKISVIIPVFNSEEYIERAFNSLLNQTVGFESLEVIFVDDKSTDSSPQIIKNYSDEYDNVKSIFLDRNSGSGGKPRNVGMSHTTSDYLMFLDSDDTLMEDACKTLYDEITHENVDIVSGVHTWDGINPSGGLWQSILTNPHDDFQTRQDKVNEMLKDFPLKVNSLDDCESIIGDFAFTPKIYKKSFLEKNSIVFPEGIIAEDSVFLLNALLNANGIKYLNKIIYHYYHERIGVDNPSVSYVHSKKYLKSLLDAFYKMYYLSLEKNKSKIFNEYLLFQKLEYFLNSRLLKSNLSVNDILDLLIYSSPLFKLCGNVNSNLTNLYESIANKDYENALLIIFGEDTLNQKDIKVISNVTHFKEDCNLIELQSNSWLNQFESEKPNLFIFKEIENEEILNYCKDNNIRTISINADEKDFRQILDSINFKYIPYLKHLVVFYELDDLRQINDVYNHFYSINYPFKHLKLITSKKNLFLSDAILKSDLEKLHFDDNYYFCFANLSFKSDLIKNELVNFSIENNMVFNYYKFEEIIKTISNPKISVVIPVFNVENYLRECLDSVVNQSFKDIEIICVNDGSTDNSLEILKEYEKSDSRISIISKENGGLSSARNAGLKLARGKYVYLIDSDDYLNRDALKECYEISEKNDLDLLMFKLQCFNDETKEKFTDPYFEMDFLNDLVGENVFNYKDLGKRIFDVVVTIQSSFFKHDLIDGMNFHEGLIFEDNIFFTEALFKAQKVFFYNKYLYNYRFRENSITSSDFSNFSDIIEVSNLLMDLTKKYADFNYYKEVLYDKKLFRIRFRFSQVTEEYKQDFFDKIQKDFLKFKGEFEHDESFQNLSNDLKNVFYAGLYSKDYKEFDNALKGVEIMISVIIPVYNKQDYISETLESIENQTLDDIEVICIDDGSTDNSVEIIEKFNNSFKLEILKQNNSGPGIARNKGLEMARGDYVAFLDADDLFEDKQALEKMYNFAKITNANMVSANLNSGDTKKIRYRSAYTKFYEELMVIKPDDYGVPFFFGKNIFKNSFLRENGITFPNLKWGEDPVFLAEILSKIDEIPCLPLDFYYYRISETPGIEKMDTPQKKQDYVKHFKDTLSILKNSGYSQMFDNYVDILKTVISHPNYNSDEYVYNAFCKEFGGDLEIYDNLINLFQIHEANGPKISVVIPVYNVENYLKECLDSVCGQNFKDIEIICVNDGSIDNSLDILKEYEKLDSRISIISKENGGLSSARNMGLEQANGKYVYFLGADDYLNQGALKECYEISENKDLDMLLFKLQCFNDGTEEKLTIPYFEMDFLNDLVGENVFDYKDVSDRIFDLVGIMQSTFFRRDLISKIHFSNGLIFEDNVFFTEALFKAQRIFFYNRYLCNYRVRDYLINASNFESLSNNFDIMKLVINTIDFGGVEEFKEISHVIRLYNIKFRFSQVSEEFKGVFFNKIQKDFLKFKDEYEHVGVFQIISKDLRKVFYACLNSNNYKDFENQLQFNGNDIKKLKNKNFTIISHNCVGGVIYHDLGLKFNTPTINLFFMSRDFIKFCQNLKYYLDCEIMPFNQNKYDYPIAQIDDVLLYGLHYDSFDELKESWEKRKERVNFDNLFFMMSERDGCTKQDILNFDSLPCKNKVIFVHKPMPEITSAYYIPGTESFEDGQNCVVPLSDFKKGENKRYIDDFDYISFLNHD